ncbi:MAG: PaaI family thioesterase [Marmoricola sp.]|nr:PaaI family thioesterase [Marmoricola sp.]
MTEAEVEQEREVLGGLATSVRALVDASLRSTIPLEEVADIRAAVDELTERLRREQIPGSFGVSFTPGGTVRGHGNAVVGLRNPVAVPLDIRKDDDGHARSSFTLGAVYEGPPGCVHGGVLALLLDQVLGECAAHNGSPGMTGTLTLRYLRPTPLGDCSIEAWVDRVEGVKTFVRGEFRRADGRPTVEVEGVFILPKWAREALAEEGHKPPRFE